MKHIKPFHSVFDGARYCGSLIYSPRGWACHDAAGKRIGEFEDVEAAVKRLRRPPRSTGISSMTSTGHLKRYVNYFDTAGRST